MSAGRRQPAPHLARVANAAATADFEALLAALRDARALGCPWLMPRCAGGTGCVHADPAAQDATSKDALLVELLDAGLYRADGGYSRSSLRPGVADLAANLAAVSTLRPKPRAELVRLAHRTHPSMWSNDAPTWARMWTGLLSQPLTAAQVALLSTSLPPAREHVAALLTSPHATPATQIDLIFAVHRETRSAQQSRDDRGSSRAGVLLVELRASSDPLVRTALVLLRTPAHPPWSSKLLLRRTTGALTEAGELTAVFVPLLEALGERWTGDATALIDTALAAAGVR